MKRHESLAPLSREHHSALILAQLLKKNAPEYKGLPTDTHGKIIYAMNMFRDSLKEHFRKEEALLEKLMYRHADIAVLGSEIIKEHRELEAAFLNLDKTATAEESMDRLGNMLDVHIRKEERVLFPMIQEHCSAKELEEIGSLLH